MPREFGRTDRIADYLRQEVARLIQAEVRDPRIGMVTVSEVQVSRDLAHAKVFVTLMNRETEADARGELEVLNRAAGFLRTLLSRDATMRTVPRLHFVFDTGAARARSVSSLIDRALADDARHHADAGEPGADGADA